jgi:hypothetical protein
MSESEVTRDGVQPKIPGRGALTGSKSGRRRRRGGEQAMVPDATFTSYYGKPIINSPVWSPVDIGGYLFLGGLAGASSGLAAAADLTGRRGVAKVSKVGAAVGATLSLAALVHDLGKPSRFINMLRVFKVTSPMSVGSWLLAGYAPAAIASAGSAVTGILPRLGLAAGAGAAVLGPGVSTYTAALVADTAVPAWHDARRELPFLFAAGAATSAGGAAAIFTAPAEAGPARRLALAGFVAEQAAMRGISRRLGPLADAYKEGPAGRYDKAATWLGLAGGLVLAGAGRRRAGAAAGGALLLASAVATRFAVFHAGSQSAEDPEATIGPQRARLAPG